MPLVFKSLERSPGLLEKLMAEDSARAAHKEVAQNPVVEIPENPRIIPTKELWIRCFFRLINTDEFYKNNYNGLFFTMYYPTGYSRQNASSLAGTFTLCYCVQCSRLSEGFFPEFAVASCTKCKRLKTPESKAKRNRINFWTDIFTPEFADIVCAELKKLMT
jgi:hypothetical protein